MLDRYESRLDNGPNRDGLPAADGCQGAPMHWCELCGRWVQNLLHSSEARFKDAHQTQGAA